ncbi:MAG: RNA polymerase sigma factor [Clostridia bacterium]|nr:RNA polymerase sigma factor [Clostridia bacterium]
MEVDKQRISELVSRIQGGDKSAFDELYKLTNERAYFVALEFTKNKQDAEDILQESYMKALSRIKELDKPESFSSWLNQIVANKSKDFLKKKKPMLFNSDEEETNATELLPDENTEFSPEDNLDQSELQKTVMEVLDELSEEKRACVLMMYFEELSVGEIAETLEIPEGTVKTRLFSARKDLKDKFAKRGITSLYSTAPIGVVIWAMRRMSETVSKTFVGSGASAKVLAGITVAGTGTAASIAAGTTAATTAATAAATTAATATGTATATGVAAKIAALTVAQKVIAGVSVAAVVAGSTAGVVTVVNNRDKNDDVSTTAYTEEYTTAPSFETTLAVEAMGTVEFSQTTVVTESEAVGGSTTKPRSTSGGRTTSSATKTTTKSATRTTKPTTTKKSTTTRKATTTKNAATTKVTTTKKQTTTEKETTTKKVTTTKVTTTKATTTEKQTATTTKAATTTTTKATTAAPATAVVDVLDGSGVVDTLTFSVPAGTSMTKSYIIGLVESEGYTISNYGVFGMNVDLGSTAESGETYRFEAEL